MADKSLLSLREIARELNLNYRMMLNYKNQLQDVLPGKYDGWFNKYPSECTDLFRLVSALRDEGYTFQMIRTLLAGEQDLEEDDEIKEWVIQWRYRLLQIDPDQSRQIQTDPDQSRQEETDLDQSRVIQNNPGQSRSIQIDTDTSRSDQSELDGRMDAEQLKEEVLDHIQSQHIAQLNSTITKLYQALTELQEATTSINQRLARLESELNGQAGEEPEFSQLDLEELQVGSNPQPAPIKYNHADLEFVKASIQNGKPNRDAVLQWALAERERDPGVSYGHLAQVLDQAGIPTLSGRTGWHRTTLRNLVIKSNG